MATCARFLVSKPRSHTSWHSPPRTRSAHFVAKEAHRPCLRELTITLVDMTSAQPTTAGITVHSLGGIPAVTFDSAPPKTRLSEYVTNAIAAALPNTVHPNAKTK